MKIDYNIIEKKCLSCCETLSRDKFHAYRNRTLSAYCIECRDTSGRRYRDKEKAYAKRDELVAAARKKANAEAYKRKLEREEQNTPGARAKRAASYAASRERLKAEAEERRKIRSVAKLLCAEDRTCAHCGETSRNFTSKNTICRPCRSAYNYSYKYGNPNDKKSEQAKRDGIRISKPAEGKIGRWGCFEVMADGCAICDCGTKFQPTKLDFKFSRPCWHFEAQAENNRLARMTNRD